MKGTAEFVIGSRIVSDSHFATVLYVGEVPPTKGEWLGVEWDDPKRGKHDGSHEGMRYFTTKCPNSGSFLRPKKATSGVSLVAAIKERYGLVKDDNAGVDVHEMFVMGKNQQTVVKVVGAQSVNKQQCQFDRLREVGLRDSLVRDGGASDEIRRLIPNVEELSLSKNLLTSWAEVARIAGQLQHLWSLNISENRLTFPESCTSIVASFSSIKTLYINRMGYSWEQVLQCTDMMNCLHHIHLCFNKISVISNLGSHLDNIKLINLESNPLSGWDQVLTFGKLKNLETLILNDTGLDTLSIPDVPNGQVSELFTSLQTLSISNNKINKWCDLNHLNKLRSLKELNFKRNTVLNDYSDGTTPRTIILGKLAKVQMHNHSKVLAVERKGAELDYLKMHGQDWRKSGGHQDPAKNKPSAAFTEEHPRYQELINKYGPVEDSELKVGSSALKNNLINVLIVSPLLPDNQPFKKKLPVSMTVQKLKQMTKRLFRINAMNMTITYTSTKMSGPEIEMETDQKEMGFYSIEEGDTIHVKWS